MNTENDKDNQVGMAIRKRRKELRLTQEELAYLVGVSRTTITKYEKGEMLPSAKMFMQLDAVFHGGLLSEIGGTHYNTENLLSGVSDLLDDAEIKNILKASSVLNRIGRGRLLEQAELMSKSEKFTSTDLRELLEMWGRNLVDEYYSAEMYERRYILDKTGTIPIKKDGKTEYVKFEDLPDDIDEL